MTPPSEGDPTAGNGVAAARPREPDAADPDTASQDAVDSAAVDPDAATDTDPAADAADAEAADADAADAEAADAEAPDPDVPDADAGPETGVVAPADQPTTPPSADPAAGPIHEPDFEATTGGRPLGSGYLIDAVIGSGATGQVWRGRRRSTGEPVAVKVLRPELAEEPEIVTRFFRERATLVRLRHPHLVGITDLVAEGNTLAIVMDLVPGEDLRKTQRRSRLGAADALAVLAQTADALAVVHEAGVVHRDVKPENVLIERGGDALTARLTDFGIARTADSATLTRLTQLIGTPAYIAPELVSGRAVTPAVDVYGLGVVAYELLAGRRPFSGPTAALLNAHVTAQPDRPPELSDATWDLISRCLRKEPTERPTATALAEGFRRLGESDGQERNGHRPGNGPTSNGPTNNGATSNGPAGNPDAAEPTPPAAPVRARPPGAVAGVARGVSPEPRTAVARILGRAKAQHGRAGSPDGPTGRLFTAPSPGGRTVDRLRAYFAGASRAQRLQLVGIVVLVLLLVGGTIAWFGVEPVRRQIAALAASDGQGDSEEGDDSDPEASGTPEPLPSASATPTPSDSPFLVPIAVTAESSAPGRMLLSPAAALPAGVIEFEVTIGTEGSATNPQTWTTTTLPYEAVDVATGKAYCYEVYASVDPTAGPRPEPSDVTPICLPADGRSTASPVPTSSASP
jgi:hypothetical protein